MTKLVSERVDTVHHMDEKRAVLSPPYPKSVKIEITSRCNFKCSFCGNHDGSRKKGDMEWPLYKRIIDESVKLGVTEVGLFLLGEPFLRKDLPELIKYAKQAGIEYVFVTTNGSLCTKDNLKACIDAGLSSLKFSVNAARSSYAEVHGVPVEIYDRTIDVIKWLYEYKKQNNLQDFMISASSVYIEEKKDECVQLESDIRPFVDDFYYLPLYNKEGTQIYGDPGRLANLQPPIPCWGLFNYVKITWDGWMIACYFGHKGVFKIVDLNNASLLEAWNDEKLIALRKEHLDNKIENSVCRVCLGLKEK